MKIFSATMFAERDHLGEKVTDWIAAHPSLEIVEISVSQSSDASFHCLAIIVFYHDRRP